MWVQILHGWPRMLTRDLFAWEGEEGEGKGKGRGVKGREREKIVALWQANRQIIDFQIWPTKIFKLNFLHFWLTDFSKIFRKRRGVDYLSICKFKNKSIGDKFFYRKFGWGAIAPQGAEKSQKVLRWIDRGSRDLFNGVKILALRSAKLKINGVKLVLSKKYWNI